MNSELKNVQLNWAARQYNLREILKQDFKTIGELPISGGWGYSEDEAIIIDRNDPVVMDKQFFNGVGIEYIIVEKRIYEELIIFRSRADGYCGIEWKLQKQRTYQTNERQFDHLIFNVTCFRENDFEKLKEEAAAGFSGKDGVTAITHLEKRAALKCHYTTEYFFDITSFF